MKWLDNFIYWIEVVVGCIAMLCIAGIVFATVVARYIFKTGILWADEVVLNLFVLLVMMGGALCFRFRKHTEMTMFLNALPRAARMVFRLVLEAFVLLFLILFIYSGIKLVLNAGSVMTSILRIPMTYLYSMLSIGGLLMLYEFLKDSVKHFLEDRTALQRAE